jgi:protein gp37
VSEDTGIAYVHSSWNVYRGCTVTKCEVRDRCWAAAQAKRSGWNFTQPHILWGEHVWTRIHEWNRQAKLAGQSRLVFAGDLSDIFQDHPVVNRIRPRIWSAIKKTPYLTYYISTKVPENIKGFLPDDWGTGYPNVWLAVTVTSQLNLWRMDALRDVPAVLRAVSAEPLLDSLSEINLDGFGWVIVGGESVSAWKEHRMRLMWARGLWKKTRDSNVKFFFKQISAPRDSQGIDALERECFRKIPASLQTREWPETDFPMMPIREKGQRFTEGEWRDYQCFDGLFFSQLE